MESQRFAKKRDEVKEVEEADRRTVSHGTASETNKVILKNSEVSDDYCDLSDENVENLLDERPNKFHIDYSLRGTAKCKVCKKAIPKGALRMGEYILFKAK